MAAQDNNRSLPAARGPGYPVKPRAVSHWRPAWHVPPRLTALSGRPGGMCTVAPTPRLWRSNQPPATSSTKVYADDGRRTVRVERFAVDYLHHAAKVIEERDVERHVGVLHPEAERGWARKGEASAARCGACSTK